jgi:hypothetical protein
MVDMLLDIGSNGGKLLEAKARGVDTEWVWRGPRLVPIGSTCFLFGLRAGTVVVLVEEEPKSKKTPMS